MSADTVNGHASPVIKHRPVKTAKATAASAQAAAQRRAVKAAYTLARAVEDLDDTTLAGLKKLVDAEIERRLPDPDGGDERWLA